VRSSISCRNGAILRFGFLACRNRAGCLCPDETCWIALKYASKCRTRRISCCKLIRRDWVRSPISCQNITMLRFGFLVCRNCADRLYQDENYRIALWYDEEYLPKSISRFELIRSDWVRSLISCQNRVILRFGFLACQNRASHLCPDETCRIALWYDEEYLPRRISRFELIRSDWVRCRISCQNSAILWFEFLACRNRAGRLCPDETCQIAL